MEVTVNQQLYTIYPECTVQTLLSDVLNRASNGLAIAINQTIISKADWGTARLKHGDQVIIITATQGG
ncbi:sulfur carrier protein ThiS [Mucilaginibacter pocheonensis]|uniref:Sulfur carrier protein n=1 Tax=Mucilaginibacter pocheonensis TaxID=398050 RepID=A0ABU1TCW1_9SPHI|nr:sulfur carrier protein ThiS [Mucilaginibacter pocheonensis]MDR6943129.1 sulfur carrier protein [Mucilaginibacter pocheonensis]